MLIVNSNRRSKTNKSFPKQCSVYTDCHYVVPPNVIEEIFHGHGSHGHIDHEGSHKRKLSMSFFFNKP